MPRGKYIAMNAYIKKQERPKFNNLTLQLKEIENKLEQIRPKACRRKEVKIKAGNDEIENRKTVEKNSETKVGSLRRSRKLTNLQLDLDYEEIQKNSNY